MTMDKTAFVTGSTGFFGNNLLRALCAQGWEVTALHRPTSDLSSIQDLPIRLVAGTLDDPLSLISAIPKGVNTVFHTAADTSFWFKNNDQQYQTNVIGTRNMVDASASRGARNFIHTSSISAWGHFQGHITEETPQNGDQSFINYDKTKFLAEREALKGIDKGMKVVIINPSSVLGPYDKNTWGRYFMILNNGKLPAIPPGTNDFVHVDDVISAQISAVEKGRNGHRYIISGEIASFRELLTEMGNLLNIEELPKVLPAIMIKVLARAANFLSRFTGKEPPITPEAAHLSCMSGFSFSSQKAISEFGYTPKHWKEALKENHAWLVKAGYL